MTNLQTLIIALTKVTNIPTRRRGIYWLTTKSEARSRIVDISNVGNTRIGYVQREKHTFSLVKNTYFYTDNSEIPILLRN